MEDNLFSILSTYKTTENVTPEENYSTELLVYLLNYSLENRTRLFESFMTLLGKEGIQPDEYSGYSILTQQAFYTSDNKRAYPDITIKKEGKYLFIEVKVESSLNNYELNKDGNDSKKPPHYIDQVAQYNNIQCEKEIYLLTKYADSAIHTNCPSYKKSFLWHNIATMLLDYNADNEVEKFLVDEILKYLEDKGMKISKVSYELAAGMESLNNLLRQIELILDSEGIICAKSFGQNWLGYYLDVEQKKKNHDAWVGTVYDGTELVFEFSNKKVVNAIKESIPKDLEESKDKKSYYSYFSFEENGYFCMNAEKQLDVLRKWVKGNYKKLQKYSKG